MKTPICAWPKSCSTFQLCTLKTITSTEGTSSTIYTATPFETKCNLSLVAARMLYGNFCFVHSLFCLLFISSSLRSMRDTPAGERFNFSGKTFIEDTETSHAFMEQVGILFLLFFFLSSSISFTIGSNLDIGRDQHVHQQRSCAWECEEPGGLW